MPQEAPPTLTCTIAPFIPDRQESLEASGEDPGVPNPPYSALLGFSSARQPISLQQQLADHECVSNGTPKKVGIERLDQVGACTPVDALHGQLGIVTPT